MGETLIDPTRPIADESHAIMYLSDADERANIATHAAGIVLSVCVGIALWMITPELEAGLRITCIAFSISMAAVYLFSTLSHAVHEPHRRMRMRAWDQGTIYLLIAGTYSPFIWEGSSGFVRTMLFIAVWAAAAFGFYSKVFSSYRVNAVSTVTYIMLGWLPAIPLVANTPTSSLIWMVLGGLSYTIGVVFLITSSRFKYSHAIWHLLVMTGSACHTYAIFMLCLR